MEWYEMPRVRSVLEGFTSYLLRGKKYKLRIGNADPGVDFKERTISIRPQTIPGFEELHPEDQWPLLRAEIAHEVAHARFTSYLAGEGDDNNLVFPLIHKTVEDNRIEYLLIQKEYMGKVLLPKRAAHLVAQIKPHVFAGRITTNLLMNVIRVSLSIRSGHEVTHNKTGWNYEIEEKWAKLRPLIHQSFFAKDSQETLEIAHKIKDIIFDAESGYDNEANGAGAQSVSNESQGHHCGEGQQAEVESGEGAGEGSGEGEQGEEQSEGQGGNGTEEALKGWSDTLNTEKDDVINPNVREQIKNSNQKYLGQDGTYNREISRLDDRMNHHGFGPGDLDLHSFKLFPADPSPMLPRVHQILPVFMDAFQTVPPAEIPDVSRAGGRLSMRDYIVDDTKPFISMLEPQKGMKDLAIRVICDASGSMRHAGKSELVTLFALALNEAARKFNVHYQVCSAPANILLASNDTPEAQAQANIMSLVRAPGPHEDFGFIVEQHAQELMQREEELKMIICLHDGQSNDHEYLKRVVHHYRRKGVTIIGVGFPDLHYYRDYDRNVWVDQGVNQGMVEALKDQFDNDFLITVKVPLELAEGKGRREGMLLHDETWAAVRDIPQRLARVIRNFRKGVR